MPRLYISDFKTREESSYNGQCLICNIVALCSTHEQRWVLETSDVGVLEGKVRHMVQCSCKVADGNAEALVWTGCRLDEIGEEKLTDTEGLEIEGF